VFYPPLRNANMQCALPTPFIYIFFIFLVSLFLTASLAKFTENTHKLHKIAYKMSKKFPGVGVAERGRRENGGKSAIVVGGIDGRRPS